MKLTTIVIGAFSLSMTPLQGASSPDLQVVAAKAAAAVKASIPDSKAEVQGTTALVKKRTYLAQNIAVRGGIAVPESPQKIETPDGYGVMFVIRLQPGSYKGPALPSTPQLDPQHAKVEKSFLRQCYHSAGVQQFPKGNASMVVDVFFGQYTDPHLLQHAYAELARSVTNELQH